MPQERLSPQELSRMLAQQTESVCRHYLPAGKKSGNSWVVGNLFNEPGRSLTVCIKGEARKLGRWTDHSTQEYGDLLDLIRINRGHASLGPAMAEARHFLGIANHAPTRAARPNGARPAPPAPPPDEKTTDPPATPSEHSSRLLWDRCQSLPGTLGELYLHSRSIDDADHPALRFDKALQYREDTHISHWPAIVAALTDLDDHVLAVHRTWLEPGGLRKADLPSPRKMLGYSKGAGVRFRNNLLPDCDIVIGEGIETVLSILQALLESAGIATLSATLMPRILVPPTNGRILIAADRDPAGYAAALKLKSRLEAEKRTAELILPKDADFNDDLVSLGPDALFAHISVQLRQSSRALPTARPHEPPPTPTSEPVLALAPTVPSIDTADYHLIPLQDIDRSNLMKVTAFQGIPRPHQVLAAASAYADIARIAADRSGITRVLILPASYMAAPLERALRRHNLEPVHPYIETVYTRHDDGNVSTAKQVTGLIPALPTEDNPPTDSEF
ncbi:MAG: toprim domain-containing protein [Alphaproteobacteria bacterium]|nr:toprim domain-containing protein [Alphaproteobacteria bacterium]